MAVSRNAMDRLQKLLEFLDDGDTPEGTVDQSLLANLSEEVERINAGAVRLRRRASGDQSSIMLRFPQPDLIQYRIERPFTDHYSAVAVANSIVGFQELITAVFDALRSAPKKHYRPSPENVVLSTMDIARATPGESVLVSMSMASERMLAVRKDLDRTFEGVFRILLARTSEELLLLAAQFGIAPLSMAYRWAGNAVQFGLTTTISVQREIGLEPMSLSLTNVDAQALRSAIEEESASRVKPEATVGRLIGIDVDDDIDRTHFHIKTEDGFDIRGRLAMSFPRDAKLSLHEFYRAQLFRATTVQFASGEESVEWLLGSLEPLKTEEQDGES